MLQLSSLFKANDLTNLWITLHPLQRISSMALTIWDGEYQDCRPPQNTKLSVSFNAKKQLSRYLGGKRRIVVRLSKISEPSWLQQRPTGGLTTHLPLCVQFSLAALSCWEKYTNCCSNNSTRTAFSLIVVSSVPSNTCKPQPAPVY